MIEATADAERVVHYSSFEKTRHDLLEYCKRDTWATVKLLERLRELAG